MGRQSREQLRAKARAEREAAERAARAQEQRKRRLKQLGGVLAVVVVVVVVVVIAFGGGDSSNNPAQGDGPLNAQAEIENRLAGIPQDGITLGDPDAPITIVEYGDLQCPACALISEQLLPTIIDDYVRPGTAKLELRDIHFLGEDSERLARFAAAAGEQDKLWNVAELIWANQGQENSGYATDEYLRRIGQGVPGLDVDRALADRTSQQVDDQLADAKRLQAENGVTATPTFLIGPTGGTLQGVPTDQVLDQLDRLAAEQK